MRYTFEVVARRPGGGTFSFPTYRVGSAVELFDNLLRCRNWQRIEEIHYRWPGRVAITESIAPPFEIRWPRVRTPDELEQWAALAWERATDGRNPHAITEPTVAVCADPENNAVDWWQVLHERYPSLYLALIADDFAIIRLDDLQALQDLPGWLNVDAHAPTALLWWAEGTAGYQDALEFNPRVFTFLW